MRGHSTIIVVNIEGIVAVQEIGMVVTEHLLYGNTKAYFDVGVVFYVIIDGYRLATVQTEASRE
jgi:hypothetical protein